MVGLTPMMRQYKSIKEQYNDALLFFRLGDFYELFFEDAKLASKELEITLTGRDCGLSERAPMCGVPYHAADIYVAKLVQKGFKVAICEQTQEPEETKGIVNREVVRVITPGTVIEPSTLDDKKNNYLFSIYKSGLGYGLAIVDITTGEFLVSEIGTGNSDYSLVQEITKFAPSEILVNEDMYNESDSLLKGLSLSNIFVSAYHEWAYQYEFAYKKLTEYFSVHNLVGYGCDKLKEGISAAGALLDYLIHTQKGILANICGIKTYLHSDYMMLDQNAIKNLELVENAREKSRKNSLLWLLDKTNTSIGARLLRKWVLMPLIDAQEINNRLNGVSELISNAEKMELLKDALSEIYDLERLCGKLSSGTANARDLLALKKSLKSLPIIKGIIQNLSAPILHECYSGLDVLEDVFDLIENAIKDEPSILLKEGNIIKQGFDPELDLYKRAMTEGRSWIAEYELKEKEKTGIKNLKAGYNKIFGYYLEVTKSYYDLVPDYFVRKQTLANCERFVTEELKNVESNIIGAEEKSMKLEFELFMKVRDKIAVHIDRMQATAKQISILDVLWSLATVARENNFVCPKVTTENILEIKNGRHPLVEKILVDNLFVPNDTCLNGTDETMMIITGPNMAGKSTYLKQVAIIALMAQMGSFVPASEVTIGIVDRIFTRVGASDDLVSGQSTFMVEMNEVANILHNATTRSLLILDEIGRGTSTFDGLSIAWAVIEQISKNTKLKCKTLFATHYHELTELEGKLYGVKNFCISVKERGKDIIFSRKIVRGGADKSFGLHVARLAGIPEPVIERAGEILRKLEEADINNARKLRNNSKSSQISIFDFKRSAIEEELATLDIINITPVEALNLLNRLSLKAKNGGSEG